MVTVIKKGFNKTTIKQLVDKVQIKKGLDAKKYSGVIKSKENPVTIQKVMRDEWE